MLLTVGYINVLGQLTVGIQDNMKFDAALLSPVCDPI